VTALLIRLSAKALPQLMPCCGRWFGDLVGFKPRKCYTLMGMSDWMDPVLMLLGHDLQKEQWQDRLWAECGPIINVAAGMECSNDVTRGVRASAQMITSTQASVVETTELVKQSVRSVFIPAVHRAIPPARGKFRLHSLCCPTTSSFWTNSCIFAIFKTGFCMSLPHSDVGVPCKIVGDHWVGIKYQF
jgi:hypothetical protein